MRTRSAILGSAALAVLLTAGAAQGLSGSNTVYTDDIVDGQVTTSDIRENAVTSSRIATGGVFGTDVADNSLTGADINESTLAIKKVYAARVNSDGSLVAGGDATSTTHDATFAIYTVTFPRDVSNCTAVASEDSHWTAAIMTTSTDDGGTVHLTARLHDGTAANVAFNLIVVCP